MKHRLHVQKRIFFKNPCVAVINHEPYHYDDCERERQELIRKGRICRLGTWGYSRLIHERLGNVEVYYKTVYRSYWCFQEESDFLQFKLMTNLSVNQLRMWPNITFTIHELIE